MNKEAAKSKLMKMLAEKLTGAKKGASKLLYGKKPMGALSTAAAGTAAGRSLGAVAEELGGRKGLTTIGGIIGGMAGRARGAKRMAAYEARKTNVNRALAGAGLAGLGTLAVKATQRSKD